jgi:hypothetical protein
VFVSVYDNLDSSFSFEWEDISNGQYDIFIQSPPYVDDRAADAVIEFASTGWNFGNVPFAGTTASYIKSGSSYDISLGSLAVEKDVITGSACPGGISGGNFTVSYSTSC